MLFTFANKFLNDVDLAEIKEALRVTRLGKLFYEDARADLREEIKEEVRAEVKNKLK